MPDDSAGKRFRVSLPKSLGLGFRDQGFRGLGPELEDKFYKGFTLLQETSGFRLTGLLVWFVGVGAVVSGKGSGSSASRRKP